MASAPLPEGTSDPPRRRRRKIGASLLGFHSWLGSCFAGFFVETRFQIRDGGTDAFGGCAPGNNLVGDHVLDRRTVQKILLEEGRNLLHIFERKLRPRFSLALCFAQNFTDKIVRVPERNTFVNEIVGGVR